MYMHLHSFILYYSDTEYSDGHYTLYLSANSVYLVIYTICASPGGCFIHPLGKDTLLVHPIEVYSYNCLVLGLEVQ